MRIRFLLSGLFGALTAGLAAAACDGGPLESAPSLSGTYVLQQANGVPLPFTLHSSASERHELLSESISFEPRGEVARERRFRHVRLDTGRDTTYTQRIRQEYRLRGAQLEIGSFRPCPPNANCVGNEKGTATDARIEVLSSLYRTGAEPPRLLYVRQ